MDAKLLTESGLKAVLSKHKVKDNGLEHALAAYEKLADDAHDECLEQLAHIGKLAAALKKDKAVADDQAVVDYLEDLLNARDSEEQEVQKDKAAAAKSEAQQKAKEKEKEDSKDKEEDEGEGGEEEEGEYGDVLLTAFKKVKSMHGDPLQLVVCDARPLPAIMIARRISAKHREQLSGICGGSKKFHLGTCHFEDGKFVFITDQVIPGLARRIQLSVKNHTGQKFRCVHGDEEAGEDEGGAPGAAPEASAAAAASAPAAAAPSKPESPKLAKAPDEWRAMRKDVEAKLGRLRAQVLKDLADEGPEFVAQMTQNMKRLDEILGTLDQRLADSLAKAHAAQNAAARAGELENAKAILKSYLLFVKSEEPLLAHIDDNPFGVEMNLKRTLTEKLTHMAEALA